MKTPSTSLFLIILLVIPLRSQSPKKAMGIEDCVNQFNHARVESTVAGYQYWFVNKDFLDGRTVKMSVVAPGKATHAPHHHPEDEIFFLLQGTAEFFLNGARKNAGSLTSFYCPPGSEHGIRNVGADTLRYLVIKKYEQAK